MNAYFYIFMHDYRVVWGNNKSFKIKNFQFFFALHGWQMAQSYIHLEYGILFGSIEKMCSSISLEMTLVLELSFGTEFKIYDYIHTIF